jgi:hypothetical protein
VFCLRHNESFALWITIKNTAYCCTWYLVQPSVVGGYLGCSATNERSQLYYLFLSLSLPFYLNSTHNTKKDYIYLLSFVYPPSSYYYNPSTLSKRTVSYIMLSTLVATNAVTVAIQAIARQIDQSHKPCDRLPTRLLHFLRWGVRAGKSVNPTQFGLSKDYPTNNVRMCSVCLFGCSLGPCVRYPRLPFGCSSVLVRSSGQIASVFATTHNTSLSVKAVWFYWNRTNLTFYKQRPICSS